MLPIEALQERIERSELGKAWIENPLLNQDVWSLEELGYSEEEIEIESQKNIYFKEFFLPWLKILSKFTALAIVREGYGINSLVQKVQCLRQFDEFLQAESYHQPELITDSLVQKFIASANSGIRRATISYVSRLWAEEKWLKLPYTPRRYKKRLPQIETIPEEVLHQVYENFDLFPPPLERLFRLQIALGCRISEMLLMPRQCLKKEGEQWFLLRWIAKRKHWRFFQVHSAVVELVKEQQKFLNKQFGAESDFDKLFCKLSASPEDGVKGLGVKGRTRFDIEPIYTPKLLTEGTIGSWLRGFRILANLKDKYGKRFKLTSHMFRRTKASLMAYCDAEDEYIAAVLGHGSLDMLPHYRKRSIERLEKEAKGKGYVDMYGRVTSFKPRKRRYERLAELLKVDTPLGECHRPTMLGDCQYRYACLSCEHHRVTLEDKPKLEADIRHLCADLQQAQTAGQQRRVTEINRLLELLETRTRGLKSLEQLQGNNHG